jgi:hypothetical protein
MGMDTGMPQDQGMDQQLEVPPPPPIPSTREVKKAEI